MKAFLLLLPILLAATAASAQDTPDRSAAASTIPFLRQINDGGPNGPHVTPTMERQRLASALALRAKAEELQRQDGGKLTPENAAFVRREASKLVRSWY